VKSRLRFDILPQPDDTTCGPTCLHAIYNYFGDSLPLDQVIAETRSWREGGTLAVFLASHALRRGYQAVIYTYNLHMFDPTWFAREDVDIADRLRRQLEFKNEPRFRDATEGYLDFLSLGGKLRFKVLTNRLIRGYMKRGIPILTGLSATYLYQSAREFGVRSDYDDIRGVPTGHFVVLSGYERASRTVRIADPLHPNPVAPAQYYDVSIERVTGAVLLGVLTHDANLLVIEPRKEKRLRRPETSDVDIDRRQQS